MLSVNIFTTQHEPVCAPQWDGEAACIIDHGAESLFEAYFNTLHLHGFSIRLLFFLDNIILKGNTCLEM